MIGQYPGFVLASSDCHKDYQKLSPKGVFFVSPPEDLPWGISALFADKYDYVRNLLETAPG